MGRGKGKKPKISCKERLAFLTQRWRAEKVRGIEFDFTYEEWVVWWKHHLGDNWFKLRGPNYGQFVMARYGDEGPYAPWNVKCITGVENSKEALIRGNTKLTRTQVKAIYLKLRQAAGRRGTPARLSREYGVNEATIRNIRDKLTWEHVTDPLD